MQDLLVQQVVTKLSLLSCINLCVLDCFTVYIKGNVLVVFASLSSRASEEKLRLLCSDIFDFQTGLIGQHVQNPVLSFASVVTHSPLLLCSL